MYQSWKQYPKNTLLCCCSCVCVCVAETSWRRIFWKLADGERCHGVNTRLQSVACSPISPVRQAASQWAVRCSTYRYNKHEIRKIWLLAHVSVTAPNVLMFPEHPVTFAQQIITVSSAGLSWWDVHCPISRTVTGFQICQTFVIRICWLKICAYTNFFFFFHA